MKKYRALLISVAIILVAVGSVLFLKYAGSGDNNQPGSSAQNQVKGKKLNRYSSVEDISFSDDKINLYLFWGDGCGYCEGLINFLENIDSEYSEKYNIYLFEVWKNPDNHQLMENYAETLDYRVNGVPFLIVGKKAFSGFSSSMEQRIKDAINSEFDSRLEENPLTNFIKNNNPQ